MLFESEPIYQLLRSLITIIGALGMQASVVVFKPTLKRNLLILCAYIGYCALLGAVIIPVFGLSLLFKLIPIAVIIPGMYMLYMTVDMPLSQYIFTASTQITLVVYVTVSVTLINIRLGSGPLTNIFFLILAYLVIIPIQVFLVRRFYLRIAASIKQGWWLLAVIPCALLVLVSVYSCYPVHYTESRSGTFIVYSLGAAIIVVYAAIFYFLKVTDDLSIQERNREILDLQIKNIKKSTADSKRKAEVTKKARQDAFALLSGIAELAKNENWNEILETIDKETSGNESPASGDYCSDPILNATLDSYIGRAKYSSITVETSLSLPKVLPDCCTEFSICLANAIENAIKACEKLPKNERKIIVKCTGNPKLMFEIKNTYKGKVTFTKDGVPISSATGHGIGTRSIIAFCEKHDALYSFKAEDGWFQVTVAM